MRKVVAMVVSIIFLLMLVVTPISGQAAQPTTIEPFAVAMPNLTYRSHVQNIGWMANVSAGALSGTTGRSLRMEALVINMPNQNAIEYRARVRGVGWQNFVRGGQVAGTTGRSLPIEAVEIRLTGAAAMQFDIQYQVHMAYVGWLNWVQNGAIAGLVGAAPEVQAIRIRLVPRGNQTPGIPQPPHSTTTVSYSTHVQNVGWQNPVQNGAMAGTTGRALRLEAFRANITNTSMPGGIEYRTHVQNIGWQGFVSNGAIAGTTGRSLRLEAIEIRLTGALANAYDVYYRVHIENYGWLDWARNGQSAGSVGRSLRLEGIEVRVIPRNSSVNRPQNTGRPFITLAAFTGRRGLATLESQLWNLTRNFPGQQSIYVKNLDTNEYMVINNAVRHNPASLMKLFVVGTAHEQIAWGRMQLTPQIRRWMDETITISTNDSYNWLLFHIGQGCVRRGLNQVTNFASRHGYTSTIGGHSFIVHPQPGQVVVPGGNRTTARDVGLFMEDVYRGAIVNRSASSQILDSLRRQQRLNKIPAGLPAGVRSASKTGEWAGYEHDAAIVFSRGATYVIVVMSTPGANSIQNIRTISRHVFNHFN